MRHRSSLDAMNKPQHLLAFVVLILATLGADLAHAQHQPSDLVTLMGLLARVRQVEADYRETVASDLIATVISQRGTLTYRAPSYLKRLTEDGTGFVLDGEQLRLIDGERMVRELPLSEIPPLQVLTGALRAIFAGDLERLRDTYHLVFTPRARHWELSLQPIDATLKMLVQRLNLVGTGATITRIETIEGNGDTRTMQLTLRRRPPAVLD